MTVNLQDPKDIVVSIQNVGKQYQLFDKPSDRLKHMIFWRFGKTYGRSFWAVRNVSFDLNQGEMLAIIGKNGSGKSTILQMLAGTLMLTEGTINVNGRVGALLELGSGFNLDYTGRENIQLNASIIGISAEILKGKIDSIIEFADIGDFIDQPVKVYSSGMFVRLAFAVTTGLDADVLLIDEALAVGDVFFRQKCYQRLEELRQRGVSIILVTHSLGDVEQLCERAILLNHGQVLFQGSAREAVKRYYLVEQEDHYSAPLPKITLPESKRPSKRVIDRHHAIDFPWPLSDAFLDISNLPQVSNGWARFTAVALCNDNFEPCHVFEQGQAGNFFYEIELLKETEVPHAGIEIQNEKGVMVHGKTTLEYGTQLPQHLAKNDHLMFHQRIILEISPGEYTFNVGAGALLCKDYELRAELSYPDLDSKLIRTCILTGVSTFTVILRKKADPVQLLHHGVANLPGNCQVTVLLGDS